MTVAELQEFQDVVPIEEDDENSTEPLCYALCMYNFVPEEEVNSCQTTGLSLTAPSRTKCPFVWVTRWLCTDSGRMAGRAADARLIR